MSDERLISNLEEGVAITAASLYFQKEMIKMSEEINLLDLFEEIGVLIEVGNEITSWDYIYPIIKRCVIKE